MSSGFLFSLAPGLLLVLPWWKTDKHLGNVLAIRPEYLFFQHCIELKQLADFSSRRAGTWRVFVFPPLPTFPPLCCVRDFSFPKAPPLLYQAIGALSALLRVHDPAVPSCMALRLPFSGACRFSRSCFWYCVSTRRS